MMIHLAALFLQASEPMLSSALSWKISGRKCSNISHLHDVKRGMFLIKLCT